MDRASFDKIFDDLFVRVYAIATRRTSSVARAEAVTEATLSAVFLKLGQLPPDMTLVAWVLRLLEDMLAAEPGYDSR